MTTTDTAPLLRDLVDIPTSVQKSDFVVPSLDREQRPRVDGSPVPIVTAGQWTRVPTSWLEKVPA